MPVRLPAMVLFICAPLHAPAQDRPSTLTNECVYFGPPQFESAQEPSFPGGQLALPRLHGAFVDAADSAAFGQFIRGMRPGDPGDFAQSNVSGYRLAWIVSEHGGFSAVSRGDGNAPDPGVRSTLRIGQEFVLPIRTAEGRRGLIVVSDIPCGLICRTTWYYVEE